MFQSDLPIEIAFLVLNVVFSSIKSLLISLASCFIILFYAKRKKWDYSFKYALILSLCLFGVHLIFNLIVNRILVLFFHFYYPSLNLIQYYLTFLIQYLVFFPIALILVLIIYRQNIRDSLVLVLSIISFDFLLFFVYYTPNFLYYAYRIDFNIEDAVIFISQYLAESIFIILMFHLLFNILFTKYYADYKNLPNSLKKS